MSKFKVGDKVRVTTTRFTPEQFGATGTVVEVMPETADTRSLFDPDVWVSFDEGHTQSHDTNSYNDCDIELIKDDPVFDGGVLDEVIEHERTVVNIEVSNYRTDGFGTVDTFNNGNVEHIYDLLTMFKKAAISAGFDWVDSVQIVSKPDSLDEVKVWSSEK